MGRRVDKQKFWLLGMDCINIKEARRLETVSTFGTINKGSLDNFIKTNEVKLHWQALL